MFYCSIVLFLRMFDESQTATTGNYQNAFGLKSGGVYTYDFSSGVNQVYGGSNGHKLLGGSVYGLIGADGDANFTVSNTDKIDIWIPQSGSSGYKAGDFNMNGNVNNQDKVDIWSPNSGRSSQVP